MTTIGEAKKGGLSLALFLVVLRWRPALKPQFENSLDKVPRFGRLSFDHHCRASSL
jgi:hypothetical protein